MTRAAGRRLWAAAKVLACVAVTVASAHLVWDLVARSQADVAAKDHRAAQQVAREALPGTQDLGGGYDRSYAAGRRLVRASCGPEGLSRWEVRRDAAATEIRDTLARGIGLLDGASRSGAMPKRETGRLLAIVDDYPDHYRADRAKQVSAALHRITTRGRSAIRKDAAEFVRTTACATAARRTPANLR
jgi:hypothetical protein